MSQRMFLYSKIHRATITEADVDYVGSISIDEDLMDAAGLSEYEQVHVAGLSGGERLVTYTLKAPRGSKAIAMNGAAALRIKKGEKVIIFAYTMLDDKEMETFKPKIVLMGENNELEDVLEGEIHGTKMV